MSPLVRATLFFRRTLRNAFSACAAAGLGFAVVLDAMSPFDTPYALALLGCLVVLLGRALLARKSTTSRLWSDLELGVLAMIGTEWLVIRADGGLHGDAYPAVFVCLAVLSAFLRPAATVITLACGVLLEAVILHYGLGAQTLFSVMPHAAFMVIFTGLNAAVLRAELARQRLRSQGELGEEIERLRNEARSYRLLGGSTKEREAPEEEDLLVRSGVEEIHQSVHFALRLVRESLGLHTAMLLWQNDAGTHLRISELVTDSPEILEGPFLSGDGVFGAALSRGEVVSMGGLKPGYQLPYYDAAVPVRSVCVVPVHENRKVRGLLVADRATDAAFTLAEQATLDEAARYAVRAIHNERVFLQLERAKVEQGKLYRAAETLGAAKTEAAVIEAGISSAREITSIDYAALVMYHEDSRQHELCAVSGDFADGDGTAKVGLRFRQNTGLVSMALENRHPLPYRGAYDDKKQVVFTRHIVPPKMPSIFVLPLYAHDRPLGTLVLGSRRRGAFGESVRATLEVLASHMAVSLEGARMLSKLEELATTDGMTGLLNKRALLEAAAQKITSAKRFGRKLSVLVTDIDHFKRVNDTYGHDVGDIIIKGLGDILRRAKRQTDAVARFGGEEFVVICEETDEQGALLLAERVRTELERTTFAATTADGKQATIQVTCSIGICTFPNSGDSWETLFKAADTALYSSKQGGRNRTTAYSSARAA